MSSLSPARQHPIDHHARLPQVGRRVAHRGELISRHVLGDLGVLGQQVEQRSLLLDRDAADVIHQVVRDLASDVGRQAHHHCLGDDQAVRHVEVGAHALDIDFKPLLEERFVAACRRDHPLAAKRKVPWTELAKYDYVSVAKSSGNRLLLDQALSGLPGRPQATYEAQHVTTMLGLVEAGLGVAAVPSLAMPAADPPLLVSVPLLDPIVAQGRADPAQGPHTVAGGAAAV